MTYQVRILKRAQGDLREAHDYIRRDSPEAADAVIGELLGAIEGLATSPNRAATPRDERLRRLEFRYLTAGRYLVFCKIGRATVRVYRVLHGRRAYGDLL